MDKEHSSTLSQPALKEIHTIVLTGGACGGKTTGLSTIEQELTERGYKVLIVPEAATEVMTGGILPSEINFLDFQNIIFTVQRNNEKAFMQAAQYYAQKQEVVVLFDRGCIDNKAFVGQEEFTQIVKNNGTTETKVRDFYDGVFHLMTAANGAEEFYTLANNAVRKETPEQARQQDKKIIAAWTGHPHFRVIDNSTNFEQKMTRLMVEIFSMLGVPVPLEIERKYLIKMPDIEQLLKTYHCTKLNIIQTYLKQEEPGEEQRIR